MAPLTGKVPGGCRSAGSGSYPTLSPDIAASTFGIDSRAKYSINQGRTSDGGRAVRLLGSVTLALVTAGSAVSRTQTGFPAAR